MHETLIHQEELLSRYCFPVSEVHVQNFVDLSTKARRTKIRMYLPNCKVQRYLVINYVGILL